MNEQNRLRKLLEIICLLSQSKTYSVTEISNKLDINRRSVYRYLDTIENCSYFKLDRTNSKVEINIEENNPIHLSKIIDFSKAEADLLKRAIVKMGEDSELEISLRRKLDILLRLNNKEGDEISQVKKDLDIIRAIDRKVVIRFMDYSSSNSNEIRELRLEPFKISRFHDRVWAFDIDARKNKIFKISRVGCVEVTDIKQSNRDSHKKGVIDMFGFCGMDKTKVIFDMTYISYNLLIEDYPEAKRCIRKIEEEDFYFRFEGEVAASFWGVSRFILGLIDQIRIVYPEELKDHIKKRLSVQLK